MYNLRLAPLFTVQYVSQMLRYASLLLIASKQWNDLTERWTLLGTLHRDSLT